MSWPVCISGDFKSPATIATSSSKSLDKLNTLLAFAAQVNVEVVANVKSITITWKSFDDPDGSVVVPDIKIEMKS